MSEPAAEEYSIGWVCALQEEYEAACRMLDDEFDGPETAEVNDYNTYVFGRVGAHNVVVGCLPHGRYGTGPAAIVARDMARSFPTLRFALMVGIGGGAPTRERDIRLGDVVVGTPQGDHGGVVQYDMGKRLFDGRFRFQRTGQLNAPPEVLLGALPEIQRRHNDPRKPDRVAEHLRRMDDMPSYARPSDDQLYRADYAHKGGKTCTNCEATGFEERTTRNLYREVMVHYGTIASASSVMKSAVDRNQYANDPTLNVLCFEMEAGGLINNFPCLVVRGICDYSDSHKNDEWHRYAALTAAAYARELLHVVKPIKVAVLPAWSGRMERHVAGIQKNVQEITKSADYIVRWQRSQEEEKLLEWLTPIDYGSQQSGYLKRHQSCTGQWFLDSEKYQTWLKAGCQTLFCPGIPGAGKTILTSMVIDHLSTNFPKGSNVGIAYLYCNFWRGGEQTITHFLSSLLKQLVQEQSSVPGVVQMLYDRHKDGFRVPSCEDLTKALLSVITSYTRVFIIVDALDECTTAGGCRAKLLSAFSNLRQKSGTNFMVTSRISEEIAKAFDGALCVQIHATANDLKLYLDRQMQLQHSDMFSGDIRNILVSKITNAADGIFLLAELHMNTIISLPTKEDMKHALERLCKGADGLDEKYRLAMERIEDQDRCRRDLAKQILAWVVHSKRPLSKLELQHALATKPHTTALDEVYIPTVETLRSLCMGLVTMDDETGTIRLVHYTTQQYFERTWTKWFPDAQTYIATICVTYLSFASFESGFCPDGEEFNERLQLNPLYGYAACNWGHHAREELTLPHGVLDFLSCKAKVHVSVQAFMSLKWHLKRDLQNESRRITGLHLVAYFGVHRAVEALLDKYHLDSTDTDDRTPLSWAAESGHEAVVKLLIEKGADLETKANSGRTPLFFAAEQGHLAVIKLLLKNRANLEANDNYGGTPLWLATRNRSGAVVKLLLEKGANLEARDNGGQTPLSLAACYEYPDVLELLLERGADLEARDNCGRTPLSLAAQDGHVEVVKLLLKHGVNREAKDEAHDRTPLSYAAQLGRETVVKALLEAGADIEARDEHGRTPLSYAAGEARKDMVRTLVEAGADLEAKDSNDWVPLSWASHGLQRLRKITGSHHQGKPDWSPNNPENPGLNLTEYQMQLVLLEQQNKKRLQMAETETAAMATVELLRIERY